MRIGVSYSNGLSPDETRLSVAYPSSLIPIKCRWVYGLKPLAGTIEGISLGDEWAWASSGKNIAGVWAAVELALIRGLIYFQKMEATIADVV